MTSSIPVAPMTSSVLVAPTTGPVHRMLRSSRTPVAPVAGSSPVQAVLKVPRKLVVKRTKISVAELKQPPLEPSSVQEKAVAFEPEKEAGDAATSDTPPSTSDAEVVGVGMLLVFLNCHPIWRLLPQIWSRWMPQD